MLYLSLMRKLSRSPCDASSHHSAILYGCDGVDLLWGDSVLFEEPFDDAAEARPYFDPSSVNDQDGSLSPAATPDESFAVIPGSRSHDSSQADSASQSQCRSDDDRALCSPPARRLASCYVADRQLVLLRVASNRLILPLARAAAAFVKRSSWSPIGYKRCNDFTRERLGRSRRWLTDLAALGEGFDRLPSLKSAVSGEDGGAPLSRVVATALARYATAEVVDEWIELARSVTVREFMETLKQARETGSSRPILEGEASDRQTRIDAEDEDDDDETTDRIDVRMLVPESSGLLSKKLSTCTAR